MEALSSVREVEFDVNTLASFVSQSVKNARTVDSPFFHLELDQVFPPDLYPSMLAALPIPADLPADAWEKPPE